MRHHPDLTAETTALANSNTNPEQGEAARGGGFSIKRLWPLAVIAAGIVAFFALGLDQEVSFEALT